MALRHLPLDRLRTGPCADGGPSRQPQGEAGEVPVGADRGIQASRCAFSRAQPPVQALLLLAATLVSL